MYGIPVDTVANNLDALFIFSLSLHFNLNNTFFFLSLLYSL